MVETHDPEKVLDEAERERKESIENAQEALKFFIEEVDGLIEWEDVESELAEYLGIEQSKAKRALTQIVGDIVDPVQQIGTAEDRYVGIIEFSEFSDAGAYGYTHYSDTHGRRNRVVCAKCVKEKESDSEVSHATQGEGTNSKNATWEQLLNRVTSHYADAHDSAPKEIDIGASLISGTTMGGNQAWHNGNVSGESNISVGNTSVEVSPQGSGSGLNADELQNNTPSQIQSHPHSELSGVGVDDHHDEPSAGTNIDLDSNNEISVVQGSGSGLDADKVDGKQADEIGGGGRKVRRTLSGKAIKASFYQRGSEINIGSVLTFSNRNSDPNSSAINDVTAKTLTFSYSNLGFQNDTFEAGFEYYLRDPTTTVSIEYFRVRALIDGSTFESTVTSNVQATPNGGGKYAVFAYAETFTPNQTLTFTFSFTLSKHVGWSDAYRRIRGLSTVTQFTRTPLSIMGMVNKKNTSKYVDYLDINGFETSISPTYYNVTTYGVALNTTTGNNTTYYQGTASIEKSDTTFYGGFAAPFVGITNITGDGRLGGGYYNVNDKYTQVMTTTGIGL
jgi:hypothetical protein